MEIGREVAISYTISRDVAVGKIKLIERASCTIVHVRRAHSPLPAAEAGGHPRTAKYSRSSNLSWASRYTRKQTAGQ